MSISARDALTQARTSLDLAREARGSRRTTIKHYHAAKTALLKIDVQKTSDKSLEKMVSTFEELADVLDSGEQLQEQAAKCRDRAHGFRQTLEERMKDDADATSPSAVSSGISRAGSQAGIAHHNSPANISLSSINTSSSVVSISTSTSTAAITPNATSPLQLPLPPSTQAGISLPAASTMAAPLFFSRNVEPEPFAYLLPSPNDPLQNTRQLAHCLALLQPSTPEDGLPSVMLKWRRDTQANLDEKNRLEALSVQIIETFATDARKDASAVTEVVQLTPVLSNDHFRFVLETLIHTVNDSEIIHFHSLDGLAKVIQGASPGSIDSDDIVIILRSLHYRLQSIHPASQNRLHLLLAVSRVLDAMADALTEDVDRINLHEPLADLLQKSGSKANPYLTFQAACATQALLNVSDDESFWRTVSRHVWLVLKGGAGIAKISDPTEIKDALESLERVYKAAKGSARFLTKAFEAIKDREPPTFTVREGLKFRRAWYRAIRMAELYIQAGRLVLFKELVTTLSCRDQFLFQWGICQLLGQFAADTRWDLEARRDAVAFLEALSKDDSLWKRQKKVDQVVFDVLTNLTSEHAQHFEAAKPLLEEMRKQTPSLKRIADLQSPIWNSMRSADPTRLTASNLTLLKAVQDEITRNAKLASLAVPIPEPSLEDIHSALNDYHAPDLVIRRVSGDELDLETCFINLAIVEASAQREKEKENLKEQATVSHRIKSYENVKNTNTELLIPLDRLFDKRKLCNGTEITPRRILVQGRAGIGKTTLCKKLVHAYQSGLWKDKFDSVLWIPLRQLRRFKDNTLERLFRKVFTKDSEERQQALAKALVTSAKKGKVLFILDGMDEIVADTEGDDRRTFRKFLTALLDQEHVIITSRPSGVDIKLLPQIDLELETLGFSLQNVNDFLVNVLEPEAARTVQDFIRHTPLMQGLVNIPVQLDVICFSWDSLPTDGATITMTRLYQLMVRKLWCKDALRLEKTAGGENLTEQHLHEFEPNEMDELMATELQHLGYLAFKGMNNNLQIEFEEKDLLCAFRDLRGSTATDQQLSAPQLVDAMKRTSFLHTADTTLDSSNRGSRPQVWHFLHLTFQEYFAATWIVRHFRHQRQPCPSAGMMTMEEMTSFLQQHKYNPQFEIVWSMVAGLLEGELLSDFFELLQGSPRDLIGGRHQLLLSSCLHEARARLNSTVVAALDTELASWMHFEMETCQHNDASTSILGRQPSFPEALLVEALSSACSWKSTLGNTLRARSVLSDSAIQCLIVLLKDDDERVRLSAATALSEQPTLSESVTQYLISEVANDDKRFPWSSAAMALSGETCSRYFFDKIMNGGMTFDRERLFELQVMYVLCEAYSERTIQTLTAKLTSDDKEERSSAASSLVSHITLPEKSVQSLITALQDDYEKVRGLAALSLGRQSTLSESAVRSLIAALKHGYTEIRPKVALILKSHPSKLRAHIPHLIVALKDDDWEVRSSIASALGGLSELSEAALESLVAALKDEVARVRKSVASALGQQPTLPVWAIQALIPTLKDEDESVRDTVRDTLQRHCLPLGNSLPYLTLDEISCFYEHHLFIYSCSHVLSLQEQGDILCFYTEQGATQLGPITNDQKGIIVSAFRAVQRKAGIKA